MTDLLSQLQSATEGSRDLDIAIAEHVIGKGWASDSDIPRYTTNLQDAVSLVPKHLCWRYDSALGYAELFDLSKFPIHVAGSSDDPCLGGKPPALALCIAIIKAHESKAEAA